MIPIGLLAFILVIGVFLGVSVVWWLGLSWVVGSWIVIKLMIVILRMAFPAVNTPQTGVAMNSKRFGKSKRKD